MAHDVFISHSAAEQVLADALCQDLEKKGFISWLAPRDVPRVDKTWSGEFRTVKDAVQNCRVFLLLLSQGALESERISEEADLARRLQRRFCVIALQSGLPEPETLPYFSPTMTWKDVTDLGNYEKRLAITACIGEILAKIDSPAAENDHAEVQAGKNLNHEATEPSLPLIFVSYKREDLPRITPIIQFLGGARYALWIDKKIPGGVEWDTYIESTIKKSSLVLLFLSHTAVASKHVRREVKFADRLDKPLLTVLLEPVDLGQGLDMLLTQFQMIDATRDDFFPVLTHSLDTILKTAKR